MFKGEVWTFLANPTDSEATIPALTGVIEAPWMGTESPFGWVQIRVVPAVSITVGGKQVGDTYELDVPVWINGNHYSLVQQSDDYLSFLSDLRNNPEHQSLGRREAIADAMAKAGPKQ